MPRRGDSTLPQGDLATNQPPHGVGKGENVGLLNLAYFRDADEDLARQKLQTAFEIDEKTLDLFSWIFTVEHFTSLLRSS